MELTTQGLETADRFCTKSEATATAGPRRRRHILLPFSLSAAFGLFVSFSGVGTVALVLWCWDQVERDTLIRRILRARLTEERRRPRRPV